MIAILLTKPTTGIVYNITQAVTSVKWSGAYNQACRQLEFSYINSKYVSVPRIAAGDIVSAYDYPSMDEIFYGMIFGTERSSEIGTLTFTAYDPMKHLLESKGQYVFSNITPEAIAQQVCADAQVPVRFLYPTGVNIKSLICNNMTYYDIIMAAYTKAKKILNKTFFAMIYKRGFSVYHAKWFVKGFVLSDRSTIYSSDITENFTSVVNRIQILDDKNKIVGQVQDADSISRFGIFQDTYTQEQGVDPATAAGTKLKTLPDQEIKIDAVGDINCIANYFVPLHDAATGLNSRYFIESDEHTWQNGIHTMSLKLRFDAIMDTKDASEEEEK